jgi:hypothetical protein
MKLLQYHLRHYSSHKCSGSFHSFNLPTTTHHARSSRHPAARVEHKISSIQRPTEKGKSCERRIVRKPQPLWWKILHLHNPWAMLDSPSRFPRRRSTPRVSFQTQLRHIQQCGVHSRASLVSQDAQASVKWPESAARSGRANRGFSSTPPQRHGGMEWTAKCLCEAPKSELRLLYILM